MQEADIHQLETEKGGLTYLFYIKLDILQTFKRFHNDFAYFAVSEKTITTH